MPGSPIEASDADALDLLHMLWRPPISQRLFNNDGASRLSHDAYCDYYRRQWHIFAVYADEKNTAVSSHASLARLVQDIHTGKTWEQLMAALEAANATEEACESSLNLAARLLTMMKVGVPKHQLVPRRFLRWHDGSLQQFVHSYFNESPKLSFEQTRLPKSFDAWSIAEVAGIEIDFTDNLADHLLLVNDSSKLLIFHHASFLEYHRNQSAIFPDGLANETLHTLALLFPQAQYATKNSRHIWFRKLCKKHEHSVTDRRLVLCGILQAEERQISEFKFWRDRLIILKQAYDDATPKTLSQWWHDRRNGVQWYTFWVAILVLLITTFLSLVQTIEGGMQVYKAYVPNS